MTNLADRRGRRKTPAKILLTDKDRLADPTAAIAALNPGDAVILRHYGVKNRPLMARELARLCRRRGLLLLVAGDARLARAVHADGLHLPEKMAFSAPRTWRLWLKPGWLVTVAAHSPAALARAGRLGFGAALLSPVFSTPSHPLARPIGPLRFAAWSRRATLPVYPLGGITRAAWRRLGGRRGGCAAAGPASVSNF